MEFQVTYNPFWEVGDIIKVEGKNWRVTKKTRTAIAVERYYFWNRWIDAISARLEKR